MKCLRIDINVTDNTICSLKVRLIFGCNKSCLIIKPRSVLSHKIRFDLTDQILLRINLDMDSSVELTIYIAFNARTCHCKLHYFKLTKYSN